MWNPPPQNYTTPGGHGLFLDEPSAKRQRQEQQPLMPFVASSSGFPTPQSVVTSSLPLGIQSFEKIIKTNSVYVDKTELIHKLVSNFVEKCPVLFVRPRKFGKTLLLSTVEKIFSGQLQFFAGTTLGKIAAVTGYTFSKKPVIKLDFARYSFGNGLDNFIFGELEALERTLLQGESLDQKAKSATLGYYVTRLLEEVYAHTGEKVVILIDNYDWPLWNFVDMNLPHMNEATFQAVRSLRSFYLTLKSLDPCIHFMLITGCTHAGYTIFLPDNLEDISLDATYQNLTGFTCEEIVQYFGPYINELSRKYKLSEQDILAKLNRKYGGYLFADPEDQETTKPILQPQFVLQAFKSKSFLSTWSDMELVWNIDLVLNMDLVDLAFNPQRLVLSTFFKGCVEGAPQFLFENGLLTFRKSVNHRRLVNYFPANRQMIKLLLFILCNWNRFLIMDKSNLKIMKVIHEGVRKGDTPQVVSCIMQLLSLFFFDRAPIPFRTIRIGMRNILFANFLIADKMFITFSEKLILPSSENTVLKLNYQNQVWFVHLCNIGDPDAPNWTNNNGDRTVSSGDAEKYKEENKQDFNALLQDIIRYNPSLKQQAKTIKLLVMPYLCKTFKFEYDFAMVFDSESGYEELPEQTAEVTKQFASFQMQTQLSKAQAWQQNQDRLALPAPPNFSQPPLNVMPTDPFQPPSLTPFAAPPTSTIGRPAPTSGMTTPTSTSMALMPFNSVPPQPNSTTTKAAETENSAEKAGAQKRIVFREQEVMSVALI